MKPHFRYCCSVWVCGGSTEINQLQKLQSRAVRMITNSSIDGPSRPLIKVLGWKTVDELISGDSKAVVCKLDPQYLCDFFTRNSSDSSNSIRDAVTMKRREKVSK